MTTPQHSAVTSRPPSGPVTDHPAIEFTGVHKDFLSHGDVVAAVKPMDLAIAQGEFFSLLGPSGCGKTTTMRMIAGFEDPTGGKVYLDGRDVTGVSPNKRDVNMVFQSYALFPHLNTYQNVAFGLERKKVAKGEIRRRVAEILEIVSLTGMEKRAPKEMSGGQQQRVALARALVNRPRALLLDEPLGALDLKLRQQMQVELKRIQREVGITFVYVTHDQGEALTMSDRIAVMNAGVIEQLGRPREIYERPASRFVAGFIGTSNLVEGRVERADGGYGVLRYDGGDRVVTPMPPAVHTGDRLEVSIRPEKIDLHRGTPPASATGGSVLSGVVTEVVYHGTATNYTVATSAGADFTVFDQNATDAEDLADRGDHVFLTWAPQHSYPIGV
jgi:spermidine/putrescine transport system ATP-binding protein